MKKIRESFIAVVEGKPRREHYINVTIVVLALAALVGIALIFTRTFLIGH